MNTNKQIKVYIQSLPEPKQSDIQRLHNLIMQLMPNCKLWYLDGKDDKGKVVTNPNIGYGLFHIKYADGHSKEFYQIGISANSTGISIYFMGLKDKTYLSLKYGSKIGKASVTGYCLKFKKLSDINTEVLKEAIQDRINSRSE